MIKILLLNSLFCSLPSLKHYVIGQEKDQKDDFNMTFKRYVLEDDFKPPIFGSHKYDPITQLFELPEGTINVTAKHSDAAAAFTKVYTNKVTSTADSNLRMKGGSKWENPHWVKYGESTKTFK